MELDFAFIAEKAGTAADGKMFCVGGGFDAMVAPEATRPRTLFPFSLVARFIIQPGEIGDQHVFQVEMENPTGELGPRSEPAIISSTKNQYDESAPVGSLMVANMHFAAEIPGTYRCRILVDGNLVKTIPVRIVAPPANAPLAEDAYDEQKLWDEIDRIAPSNDVLLAYARSHRKPPL